MHAIELIKDIVESHDDPDVIFLCGDEEIAVHKSWISMISPVFKEKIAESEDMDCHIVICDNNDTNEIESCKKFIDFCYGRDPKINSNNFNNLYQLSKKYKVKALQRFIENHSHTLTTDNVITILNFAMKNDLDDLQIRCTDWIASCSEANIFKIWESEQMINYDNNENNSTTINGETIKTFVEICGYQVDCYKLFKTIINWAATVSGIHIDDINSFKFDNYRSNEDEDDDRDNDTDEKKDRDEVEIVTTSSIIDADFESVEENVDSRSTGSGNENGNGNGYGYGHDDPNENTMKNATVVAHATDGAFSIISKLLMSPKCHKILKNATEKFPFWKMVINYELFNTMLLIIIGLQILNEQQLVELLSFSMVTNKSKNNNKNKNECKYDQILQLKDGYDPLKYYYPNPHEIIADKGSYWHKIEYQENGFSLSGKKNGEWLMGAFPIEEGKICQWQLYFDRIDEIGDSYPRFGVAWKQWYENLGIKHVYEYQDRKRLQQGNWCIELNNDGCCLVENGRRISDDDLEDLEELENVRGFEDDNLYIKVNTIRNKLYFGTNEDFEAVDIAMNIDCNKALYPVFYIGDSDIRVIVSNFQYVEEDDVD